MSEPKHEPNEELFVLGDDETKKVICKAIAEFKGPGTQLESAIGALVLGQHFGTRALKMIHSPTTYRKYETLLGISYEDHCPERTHLSKKIIGIRFAEKLGSFWDVVMGRAKVERKGWMEDPASGE